MRSAFLAAITLVVAGALYAQSTNASLAGRVIDPSKARIAGARVAAINIATNIRDEATSNASGEFYLSNIAPGTYRLEVESLGFRKVIRPNVILHVQDAVNIDFEMTVGSASESITVEGGAPLLNTSDATVSTLVDNRFVENMPLNGRSFGSLIDLAPGATLVATNFYEQGQFSVNGQRPDSNYFMVDGVSANLGTPTVSFEQGGTGQLPATNAFGGMSNLVSLDALQEFRIQTSTFAPEFGRTPGAQVSVVTRSGTNALHGTLFEYLRNDVFDSNDWFADNEHLKKPELRQNDFGGVLGGPIIKDRLFFFGSYEGLRLRQPRVANTYVPNLATLAAAPAAVQPLLNALPKPTPGGQDFGNGTAAFTEGYSDPSSLDSFGLRMDYAVSNRLNLFGRYSGAPSSVVQRGGGTLMTAYSDLEHTEDRTQTITAGVDGNITPRFTNAAPFQLQHESRAQLSDLRQLRRRRGACRLNPVSVVVSIIGEFTFLFLWGFQSFRPQFF